MISSRRSESRLKASFKLRERLRCCEKFNRVFLVSIENERNQFMQEIRKQLRPGKLICSKNKAGSATSSLCIKRDILSHFKSKSVVAGDADRFGDNSGDRVPGGGTFCLVLKPQDKIHKISEMISGHCAGHLVCVSWSRRGLALHQSESRRGFTP